MASERYQRLQAMKSGGMSELWLALDTYTQKRVVLKIMKVITEDERRNHKSYERFWREIEIARSLQNPYVLPIIDYGEFAYEQRPRPFLVSPYIPEGSLADLIVMGPPWEQWSLRQTADVILQAAESLWYLHTRVPLIVHQDVKPGNFLVRSLRTPHRIAHLYLCDFGISRWQKSSSMMASEVLGTFAYMAPEQIAKKVNCASDQYALAVMACHLLTGRLPIQAETNEEYADAHIHDVPMPPSQLNPRRINSAAVDAVILHALEKNPGRRFPTILIFAQELQRALMEEAMKWSATAPTERADLTLTATTILPGVQGVQSGQSVQKNQRPTPSRSFLAEPPLIIAVDPLESNDAPILDEPLPAKPFREESAQFGRGEIVLTRLPLSTVVRRDLPARPRTLGWSSDGDLLACTCYSYAPLVLANNGSLQEASIPHASLATCLCWSPQGYELAISVQGEIHFWDTNAQEALPLIVKSTVRTLEGLDWSVREQLALWVEDQIRIYTLPSSALGRLRPPAPQLLSTGMMRCGNAGTLRWSPDGTLLAIGASNGGVLCWNLAQQTPAWQVVAPGQKVTSLVWSSDGSLLVIAFRDNRIVGWNVHTRMQAFQWEKLPAMPRMLSISTERRIGITSSEKRLLFGFPDEHEPSMVLPGQLLVAWSPARVELATLSERRENSLAIWQN
jgi:serine/threonine protein kinase